MQKEAFALSFLSIYIQSPMKNYTIVFTDKIKILLVIIFLFGIVKEGISQELPNAELRTNLYKVTGDHGVILDSVFSYFNDTYNNLFDENDVEKNSNPAKENLAIFSDGKLLTQERKQLPKNGDTIFYRINYMNQGPYRFKFVSKDLDFSGQEAYLYDRYLNVITPVMSNDTVYYDFNVKTALPDSWAGNRFNILFKSTNPTSVILTNFKAYTKNNNVVVEWKAATESNMRSYTIESSTDGRSFNKVFTTPAQNKDGSTYHWDDVNVKSGYRYYRILSTELDSKSVYTKIIKIWIGENSPTSKISVYPNPIKGGVINLQFQNELAGDYQLHLLNTSGQIILKKQIQYFGGNSHELIWLNSQISKGIYLLEIYNDGKKVFSEKMVY